MSKSLAQKLRTAEYYQLAHTGSNDLSHPAMNVLIQEVAKFGKILDMGCGEGTRLNAVLNEVNKNEGVGVDNSEIAIQKAKSQYKNLKFLVGDLEQLPFKDNSFDLAFSAYVFEHLENPALVLQEAIRVVKKSGRIVIVAPNFGSPNRRSPNSVQNKFLKLITGFLEDFQSSKDLDWKIVSPKYHQYEVIDADATCEPYINKLIAFAKNLGLKVEYAQSYWEVDRFSFFQLPFKILGQLNIYPFNYWGPHFCVVLKK